MDSIGLFISDKIYNKLNIILGVCRRCVSILSPADISSHESQKVLLLSY